MSHEPPTSDSPAKSPLPDHPILAELAERSEGRRRGPRWTWIGIGLLIGTAVILAAVWILPWEVQQWRIASAEERRLNGDLHGAIEQLEQYISRDPRNIELRRRRAQWFMEAKDYRTALAEIDQILEWHPTDVASWMLRAQVHHHLGDHSHAVADWKKILSFDSVSTSRLRATALNGLAYARALANLEIDEGLADIGEALSLAGENSAMLDTQGFLYFRKGDLERALQDLNNAVEYKEAEYEASLKGRYLSADRRLKALEDKEQAQSVAVIRYHRSLVHDARNEKELAEADRRRVRELGSEPNEKLF